jgi:energy-coupling factor transporter ATP-binding protein EcfA2
VERLLLEYPPPRRIRALDDVSVELTRGTFAAIVGQNGSGKTSLARCVSGYLRPTRGRVLVDDRDVQRLPPATRARHIGYVFQNPDHQLFKESVWDEVAFGLRNLHTERTDLEAQVESTLRRLDLWPQRDRHPFRLSKGDRQRLAIAAIIIMRPHVLIVDEPTTGQDPSRSREIMDLLAELNGEGTTVVVITHVMELVAEYARQVLVLHAGRLLLQGTPREVFAQPKTLAITRTSPPPITRLGLALGLEPLPITIAEARDAILQRLAEPASHE